MSAAADSERRYREALAWAKKELPDEFAPFAASAAMTLNMLGQPVTAEAVRERLKSQGRDAEALKAEGIEA